MTTINKVNLNLINANKLIKNFIFLHLLANTHGKQKNRETSKTSKTEFEKQENLMKKQLEKS